MLRTAFFRAPRPLRLAMTWLRLLWWEWALSQLLVKNPAHPDVPYAVLRVHALQRELHERQAGA